MMKRLSILIMIVSILAACVTIEKPQIPGPSSGEIILDEKLIETAKRIAGFGGMFFDDAGILNVYLVEDVKRLNVEDIKAKQAQILKTIADIFGKEALYQRRGPLSELGDKELLTQPREIKIVKGNYDILQLAKWRTNIDRVLEISGVVFTDLDERQNRLKVGIEPTASREQIDTALRGYGIPREAVIIEETKPIILLSTLKDCIRPVCGGTQIQEQFQGRDCTLGFNAIRYGVNGFVTCSHCTWVQGGSEGTVFFQPDISCDGNKVGNEIADPQYFTGVNCPSGRRCRYSDSAFIGYKAVVGQNMWGEIARTTGQNNGSLTIDNFAPRLGIVGETSSWIDGSELDKIGRTTGWTFGYVSDTCQNINVPNNITLLCQYRVNRIPGQTYMMSDAGDSGSPVFRWLGGTVILSGILWGGTDNGSSFVFSPLNQIKQELGTLKTFDFPLGPMPKPTYCPSGKHCCGNVDPKTGKCNNCIPNKNPCP